MSPRGPKRAPARADASCVQVWIELKADDPEAVSALAVARSRLSEGRRLAGLRRARVFELSGALPAREAIEDLLHRSTWFYNPHKERCAVRVSAREAVPAEAVEQVVLVVERGGERRAAAERWWLHETGQLVEVREAVAWRLKFEMGEDAPARAAELAVLSGRRHGLLCNPNAQDHAVAAAGRVPLPWIAREPQGHVGTAGRREGSS